MAAAGGVRRAMTCRLYGGLGSPYSMKMRAVLRYRRIPHQWIVGSGPELMAGLFAQVKAPVIPVIAFPDGTVMNDSTPLIYELERRYPDERSIVPPDEAAAFLAFLLEDFADEWGTKAMFHYRWFRERDQQQMSRWLSYDRMRGRGRARIEAVAETFRERQVGRMALVGCTPQNAPIIEESAGRIFALMDQMATEELCLFGSRPSLADFGWFGQLSQLGVDPTPADLMRESAPYLMRWLLNLDDASGLEGEWGEIGPAARGLLRLAGELYLPFLEANDAAGRSGAETFTVELLGRPYTQGVFKYQMRCLTELRRAYEALSAQARRTVDPIADEAGLLAGLTG